MVALAAMIVGSVAASGCGGTATRRERGGVPVPPSTVVSLPKSVPDPSDLQRYEPYAGTRPAVAPVGRVTEGRITTPDGRSRHYRLYVPASLQQTDRVALLVALHGGLGSSTQFAANSGFDGLAEANRFVVVYPDGIGLRPDGSGAQTWNGGYCCGPAASRGVDDVGFVRRVIDAVGAEWSIDPARVFATGHSNGAILAYRLACELSDRIVAIGVQAGSLGVDDCRPARPVSVFHLHGTADTNHPIDGGVGSGVAGVEFRPARAAVERLASVDGCPPVAVVGLDPDDPDVTARTWSPCSGGTAVRFVVVAGATHAWMGHAAASTGAAAVVGDPYPGLDASRAIWSFLVAHPRSGG